MNWTLDIKLKCACCGKTFNYSSPDKYFEHNTKTSVCSKKCCIELELKYFMAIKYSRM